MQATLSQRSRLAELLGCSFDGLEKLTKEQISPLIQEAYETYDGRLDVLEKVRLRRVLREEINKMIA